MIRGRDAEICLVGLTRAARYQALLSWVQGLGFRIYYSSFHVLFHYRE